MIIKEELKFIHLVKYLSSLNIDTVVKYLDGLVDGKIIGKRDLNNILKRVKVNQDLKLK
jgi:hypothetical protein